MDLTRLLRPRSVAVVGASERDDSYAGETLLNLRAAGFAGPVWGVNPNRAEAHGFPCFPSLAELPEAPDAVVVGIPAAGVADVVEEAGALGCGGAVVYGAGFGEVALGADHERRLREAAARHSLPVCGPNGNGIVALHSRATLWGDTLRTLDAGARGARVAERQRCRERARGQAWHPVPHGGLVRQFGGGRSSGLDGRTGARRRACARSRSTSRATATARSCARRWRECAERGVGVAVLKAGESTAGAAAAAAHTGAVAGDQRVFRALVEEAGAAWADDVHDLLEIAKTCAVPGGQTP